MIWSDIFAIQLFFFIFNYFIHSNIFFSLSYFHKILYCLVYCCAFITRFFSFIYHTFNVMSVNIHKKLLILDYIGISSISLAYPYTFVNINNINTFYDSKFILFIFGITILQILFIKYPSMFYLSFVGSVGFILTLNILFLNYISFIWKFCYCSCVIYMIIGIFIYSFNIPECFSLNSYTKTIFYSHTLWHNFVTIAQLMIITTTFFPCIVY